MKMYTGKLVRLREYREEDLALAKVYVNSEEVRPYVESGVPFLFTLHNEKEWYEKLSPFNDEYNFAIETLDTKQYIGGCGVHNVDFKSAQKSYEKVGFKKEAVLKEEIFRNGKYQDVIEMCMFKREYFGEN